MNLPAGRQALSPTLCRDFLAWIDRSPTTTRTHLSNLRQFWAWLQYRGIANPQRPDVVEFRDWLTTEHDAIELTPAGWRYRLDAHKERIRVRLKPSTVAAYLQSVKQFFKWTAAAGLYPDIAANVHAPKVRRTTHKRDALTAAEVLDIEQNIKAHAQEKQQAAAEARKDTAGRSQRATEQGKRLEALYLLAVNAGLRTVELSRANVKDLETKGGQAWLWVWGKGHTEPDVKKPLAPEVAEAVRGYLEARTDHPKGTSPLFVGTGNRNGGRRLPPSTISKLIKAAMREAGYNSERLSAHSLRHTAGTSVMEITGNLYTTQRYMRHANPATTEIYLHNDTTKQEAETARMLYDYYHRKE